ncbi:MULTISPECIES: hypothetical protein [unclassified Methylobacterium]|uniref:hypothetical protein n=1 Tax=unclassified Methylobacterium TaxID=2615210 RepID=UPI002269AF4E|nr:MULTISPECIES: hypothetical protein [unclassified Methylobacterium]
MKKAAAKSTNPVSTIDEIYARKQRKLGSVRVANYVTIVKVIDSVFDNYGIDVALQPPVIEYLLDFMKNRPIHPVNAATAIFGAWHEYTKETYGEITYQLNDKPDQPAGNGYMNERVSAIAGLLSRASDGELVELMRNSAISDRLVHAFKEAKEMTKPVAPVASGEPEKRGRGRPRSAIADAAETEFVARPPKAIDDPNLRKRALATARQRRYQARKSAGLTPN